MAIVVPSIQAETLKSLPQFAVDPEAALASYRKLGFHLELDVFTPDECEDLKRASESLREFKAGSLKPVYHPHRQDPVFHRAFEKPAILRVIERLVSGRVQGIQTQFFHCPPGTPGFAKHQDNFYVQAKKDAFTTAWVPLQDVHAGNGCLVVYPGSHREDMLPVMEVEPRKNQTQDINANRLEALVPAQYKPLCVQAPRGSAVFIHGFVVHSSNDNNSQEFRRVFLGTYIREGETFRPGTVAKREAVELY